MTAARIPSVEDYTWMVAMAYGSFCAGKNTSRIALEMGVHQSVALRLVTIGRCYRLKLPLPYPIVKLEVVK